LKDHPIPAPVIVLMIASLACSQSGGVPASDPNAANTSIAEAISARQTEAASLFTSTSTSVPETATLIPSPTEPATAEPTLTLGPAMISVSVDTNCRVGPGAIFERVGILLIGEVAPVLGRDSTGQYWYIKNPDGVPENCWVWGEYATITGNTLPLLFMTAAPPPSTSFTLAYDGLQHCSVWWADFNIANNSGGVFRSVSMTLTDTDTTPPTVLTQKTNGFSHAEGCDPVTQVNTLPAGAATKINSPFISYNPIGHKLNIKMTLCLDNEQQGTCVTKELTFTPK